MTYSNGSDINSTVICWTFASSKLPSIHHVSFGTAYALLSVLTIASNAILLYALHKTKQLNTISNKLTLIMNVSDLCSGVITFPIAAISNLSGSLRTSCVLDKAASFFALFFGPFSFLLLFCISIDRYFRVTKMTRYNLYMNDFRMKIMIFSSLVVAVIIAFKSIFTPSFTQQVISVSVTSFFLISAIIVYMILLKRLRNHVIQFNNAREEISDGVQESRNIQITATTTIQLLLICLTVVYSPYQIISCFWTYYKYQKETDPNVYLGIAFAWSRILALANATGNSFVIIYGNARIWRFVLSLFRRSRIGQR